MILILEEDEARIEKFKSSFPDSFIARTAMEAIVFLLKHPKQIRGISLDHDLVYAAENNCESVSINCGCDFVQALICFEPFCPVIIHSSNTEGSKNMKEMLVSANWVVSWVKAETEYPGNWYPLWKNKMQEVLV